MIEAGTILQNRYLINRQVGAGGMGTVYIATDQRFGSTVAVKETIFTDSNLRKAFAREAQLLNSLRHPALPRVSDHFEEDNGMFLVMEYIEGDDLMEKLDLKKNGFAIAEVLLWAEQLLDALDYLHTQQRPVIHRDIKPQNLKLTTRGDIVLLDFGLAKGTTNDSSSVSITKSVFGYSRNYAPLEQIQGTGTDTHSDLYSLGATLYHLSTGSPPLDALTRATTVINGNEDPLKLASEINPQIPVEIAEILNKAMSLNSASRFDTAAEMRHALQAAKESAGIVSAATGTHVSNVFNQQTELAVAGTLDAD
jgi:serine/threonine protein kinase